MYSAWLSVSMHNLNFTINFCSKVGHHIIHLCILNERFFGNVKIGQKIITAPKFSQTIHKGHKITTKNTDGKASWSTWACNRWRPRQQQPCKATHCSLQQFLYLFRLGTFQVCSSIRCLLWFGSTLYTYSSHVRNSKNECSSDEMVPVIVLEGSPGAVKRETTGKGFVKQVGFKPGVRVRELRMSRVANQTSDRWRNKSVRNLGHVLM